MMGVGPAGRKSKTPQLRGRRNAVRINGGMRDVRNHETTTNDCFDVSKQNKKRPWLEKDDVPRTSLSPTAAR